MLIETLAPSYEVRLTLQGKQVTIQSTVPSGPEGWATIRQICLEGLLAAHTQFVVTQQGAHGDAPRVIVPSLGIGG